MATATATTATTTPNAAATDSDTIVAGATHQNHSLTILVQVQVSYLMLSHFMNVSFLYLESLPSFDNWLFTSQTGTLSSSVGSQE